MSAALVAAIERLARKVEALEKAARTPERKAWRPSEVAAMTGLTAERVRDLIAEGELGALKDGQRYYVPDVELDAFLARGLSVARRSA